MMGTAPGVRPDVPPGVWPDVQAAEAVFVGATRYRSPLSWVRLAPRWFAMVRQMKRMPGYLHHQVYYSPPFTLGTIGFFASRDDLLRFARTGEHRELMRWAVDGTRNATGGYIRLFGGTRVRTHDFGRAPRMARAGLMVVVGLRAGSPRGWVRQAASHRAWVTRARRSPGYRGHRAYWQPPVGVGTILWLAGPDDLAALREPPPGCWVHTLRAEPGGYTNGVWRAEDTEMAHIEHFTALTGEDQGPAARRRRRAER